jgi:hypothetical protein
MSKSFVFSVPSLTSHDIFRPRTYSDQTGLRPGIVKQNDTPSSVHQRDFYRNGNNRSNRGYDELGIELDRGDDPRRERRVTHRKTRHLHDRVLWEDQSDQKVACIELYKL